MEKTISIVIAQTTFSLTQSAYDRLFKYLEGLQRHFAHDSDGEEIVRDIESRIAEKLYDRRAHVIIEDDIVAVTNDMGEADELDDTESQTTPLASAQRKLYRDRDTAIIAGVASGIAAYFGIEPFLLRLLFALSILFGGTGIFVYLVLWLLIPAAETASQKLEMRGDPVTLQGISRMVKDRVEETKSRSIIKRILYFPFEVIGALVRFIAHTLFPIVGKLAGIVLALASFFGLIAATIAAGSVFFNWNAPYMQFPLRNAVPTELLAVAIIAAYASVTLPLILIHALGHRLLQSRVVLPSIVGFGLIGLWALAVISGGIAGIRIASQYQAYTAADPAYAASTTRATLPSFSALSATYQNVTVAKGEEYAIEISGRKRDLDSVSTHIDADTLHIEHARNSQSCFIFCDSRMPAVTVYVPSLNVLVLEGSSIELDSLTTDSLTINSRYSHVDGSITAQSLSVRTHASSLELTGAAESADLQLEFSSFDGENFTIMNATTSTNGSRATLNVSGHLSRSPDPTSSIKLVRD